MKNIKEPKWKIANRRLKYPLFAMCVLDAIYGRMVFICCTQKAFNNFKIIDACIKQTIDV